MQLHQAYLHLIQTQEAERRQLAEWLHDETLQQLADLSVRLGLLRCQAEINPIDLEELQSRLVAVDCRLREIVRGIHPAILSDLGLVEAVIAFLEALQPDNPLIHIQLCIEGFGDDRLPDEELELTLYRFTQNAVLNAIKHSNPHHIKVIIRWKSNSVEIQINDDGCGTNVTIEEAVRSGHFGLLSMRERIKALSGNFIFYSGLGQGTRLSGCIPVSFSAPAAGQQQVYNFGLATLKHDTPQPG